jgi:hypothetical protein
MRHQHNEPPKDSGVNWCPPNLPYNYQKQNKYDRRRQFCKLRFSIFCIAMTTSSSGWSALNGHDYWNESGCRLSFTIHTTPSIITSGLYRQSFAKNLKIQSHQRPELSFITIPLSNNLARSFSPKIWVPNSRDVMKLGLRTVIACHNVEFCV